MDSSRNVNNYDMLFKIVLIGIIIKNLYDFNNKIYIKGDSNVGKSNILCRFT